MPFDFGKDEVSYDEYEQLVSRIKGLEERQMVLEELLKHFKYDGWEKFRDEILVKEGTRIARERMRILVEEKDKHLVISGQFAEIEKLLKKPDEIRIELKTIEIELKEKRREMQKVLKRMEKA